jgi:hypothetical protein
MKGEISDVFWKEKRYYSADAFDKNDICAGKKSGTKSSPAFDVFLFT